jgi:hypothetical protein
MVKRSYDPALTCLEIDVLAKSSHIRWSSDAGMTGFAPKQVGTYSKSDRRTR